jgi:hypothetical protein
MMDAENFEAASVDAGEIQQSLYAGSLASAVYAHQTEKFALLHLEIHAVEHLQAGVTFGDVGNSNCDGPCAALWRREHRGQLPFSE